MMLPVVVNDQMDKFVVRIRGTFIDFVPEASKSTAKKRCPSAPPTSGRPIDDGSDYIDSWLEGAARLSDNYQMTALVNAREEAARFQMTTKPLVKVEGTHDTIPVKAVEVKTGLKATSRQTKKADRKALALARKLDVAVNTAKESNPCGASTVSDFKAPSLTTCGESDSCDTLPSLQTSSEGVDEVTTLMLCDIPCRQNVHQIIEAIHTHGFADTYDLVYMPSHKGRRLVNYMQNIGYAFVNFKRAKDAAAFLKVFQKYSFPNCCSNKLSYCKPAQIQGYKANLDMHFKQRASGCLVTLPHESVSGPMSLGNKEPAPAFQ